SEPKGFEFKPGRFQRTWAGLSNRLVGGPQKERHEG
ncbi:hypothetical protein PSYAR_31628, partial [Pseudomonas syringae pv. aceris str. M302273]